MIPEFHEHLSELCRNGTPLTYVRAATRSARRMADAVLPATDLWIGVADGGERAVRVFECAWTDEPLHEPDVFGDLPPTRWASLVEVAPVARGKVPKRVGLPWTPSSIPPDEDPSDPAFEGWWFPGRGGLAHVYAPTPICSAGTPARTTPSDLRKAAVLIAAMDSLVRLAHRTPRPGLGSLRMHGPVWIFLNPVDRLEMAALGLFALIRAWGLGVDEALVPARLLGAGLDGPDGQTLSARGAKLASADLPIPTEGDAASWLELTGGIALVHVAHRIREVLARPTPCFPDLVEVTPDGELTLASPRISAHPNAAVLEGDADFHQAISEWLDSAGRLEMCGDMERIRERAKRHLSHADHCFFEGIANA